MDKRLYRSRRDVFFAGVCGGIAEYFGIDASLIRLGFVVLTLATGGLGLIAYLIAAVVIPEEPYQEGDSMNTYAQNNSYGAGPTAGSAFGAQTEYQNTVTPNQWQKPARNGSAGARRYVGLFLVLLGGFMLLKNFIPQLDFSILAAGFLIFIGFAMIFRRR